MRRRIDWGRLESPLPYALQEDYELDRRLMDLPAITIANDRVSAVVLPQYGGRIWSLRQLSSGRDLVYRNPVLSWANLGLTNAWFAGGVEWNLGSTGHSATTSRPLYAAPVETASGPVLRLWEWERTRDLVFSVDLSLPSGSDFLYASVRVRNPDPWVKPLYWWTNVAVAETPGLRVLAPASRAWRNTYQDALVSVPVPQPDEAGPDVSYPARAPHPADYFFQIEPQQRKWIAAVGADGAGVVHTSTAGLPGRKLFVWGVGPGGDRWQERLSGPGHRYLEIQAGLATTQFEHLAMAAGGRGQLDRGDRTGGPGGSRCPPGLGGGGPGGGGRPGRPAARPRGRGRSSALVDLRRRPGTRSPDAPGIGLSARPSWPYAGCPATITPARPLRTPMGTAPASCRYRRSLRSGSRTSRTVRRRGGPR